jgi:hypothetical protein
MLRSFSLNLLALAALGLGAFNLLGLYTSLRNYSFLNQLPLAVPLAYLLACRAIWAVIWGVLAFGVGRRVAWARTAMLAGSALYLAHGWVNRLVWGRSDYLATIQPWAAAVGVLGVALAWGIVLSYPHWGEGPR